MYSYDVPKNIAISRPKMCKKKLHNRYDFLPVTGEKIELSNNARGHPIACILEYLYIGTLMHTTPRLLNQRFLDLGISPLFLNSPLTWDEECLCPRKPPYTYARTHTHTHVHVHVVCEPGDILFLAPKWGRVCRVFNTRNCDFNPLTGDHFWHRQYTQTVILIR